MYACLLSADVYIAVIIMVAASTILTLTLTLTLTHVHGSQWPTYRNHLSEPATTVVEKEM
ncbi:MAG TPA: hypothetical protein VFH09_03260 [Nitrososphaera sp.]|nr:hypothetical protein [Nitrososphaera sp.]